MRNIKMIGYAAAEVQVRTVGDLRRLLDWCDAYSIHGDTVVDTGNGVLWVMLTGENDVEAKWIECGDHIPPKNVYDVLIETHKHE